MKTLTKILAILLAFGSCVDSVQADLNISLNYFNGASAYQSDFEAAAAKWSSLLLGYQSGVVAPGGGNGLYGDGQTVQGIIINTTLANTNQFLGLGTVTGAIRDTKDFAIATDGIIQISSNFFPLLTSDQRQTVILHEMAHVLGFGSLWEANTVVTFPDPTFKGVHATAAWRAEFNRVDSPMVETQGTAGTAFGHWNENLTETVVNGQTVIDGSALTGIVDSQGRDFRNELMTGWIDTPTFISNTTVQSFADIGYITVPEPASFAVLSIAGLGTLAVWRRNRNHRRSS